MRTLLVLLSVLSVSTFAVDSGSKPVPNGGGRSCADQLGAKTGEAIGRLFVNGAVDGRDVVGLVPLSRAQFDRLVAHGRLESVPGFQVNPIIEHPRIAELLNEHPGYELNVYEGYDQRAVTAMDAWVSSMDELLRERVTSAGGRIRPEDDFQFENLVYALRPVDAAPATYAPTVDRLAQIARSIELKTMAPAHVAATLDRALSRRLLVGPDEADLARWARVRAVADFLGLPWRGGQGRPAADRRMVREFFSHLPTEAGAVVAVDARALPRIAWSREDAPRLPSFEVDDLVGIETHGQAELDILSKLIPVR